MFCTKPDYENSVKLQIQDSFHMEKLKYFDYSQSTHHREENKTEHIQTSKPRAETNIQQN